MRKDKISKIEIDDLGRMHVKPEKVKFTMIYRTATEVHWDEKELTLYCPKPRDRSYLEWYWHITKVAETECSVKLELTETTDWINIPKELQNEITTRNI